MMFLQLQQPKPSYWFFLKKYPHLHQFTHSHPGFLCQTKTKKINFTKHKKNEFTYHIHWNPTIFFFLSLFFPFFALVNHVIMQSKHLDEPDPMLMTHLEYLIDCINNYSVFFSLPLFFLPKTYCNGIRMCQSHISHRKLYL